MGQNISLLNVNLPACCAKHAKKATSTKEELRKFFNALTDETKRDYENAIVTFVMKKRKETPNDFQAILESLMDDDNDKVAFAAFVALCSILRRSKNHKAHQKLIESREKQFAGNHPLLPHLKLLLYVDGNFVYEEKDFILHSAQKNARALPNHAGVLHAFSDIVATAFEYADFIGAQPPDDHWIKDGIQTVEKAISIERNYAKFYCTKARLLALQKEFGHALKLIRTAIDLESSEEADYALRINEYLNHLQRIQFKKTYLDLHQQAQEITDKLDHSLARNLEFIGLFSGIVSFTIGSISIVNSLAKQSFVGAAYLIIVLMGTLLCAFSSFSFVLHRHQKLRWPAIVFFVGLGVLIIGIYFCSKISPA